MSDIVGPTGEFPDGKVSPDDSGELIMGIGIWRGMVRVEFGSSVSWLGLPSKQARRMAEIILSKVQEIEDENNSRTN